MRTESDLHVAFALLERDGDAYLAASATQLPTADEPTHDLVPGPARPARRRRVVLPIAAVAATVATAFAVLAVGGGGSTRPGASGPDDATPVCVTTLPAEWQAALSARTVTVDGTAATAEAIGANGSVVVSWLGADGAWRVGTVISGTSVSQVYRLPTPDSVWQFAADAHYAAMAIGPSPQGGDGGPGRVDDIVLVDLATGKATGLLADAPQGATPSDAKTLQLQDGTLYWLGVRGSNTLYSYDISARTYASTPVDLANFHWRAGGFGWAGGSIPVAGLPPVHPPLSDSALTIARDDSALAWSYYDDAATVHWSDQSGTTRDLDQHEMEFLSVEAVAGPYVFLNSGEGSDSDRVNGDVQVLDTRTGAMADTGLLRWEADHSAGGLVTLSPRIGDTIRILDTTDLPGLTC